jgi:hypothetical protein
MTSQSTEHLLTQMQELANLKDVEYDFGVHDDYINQIPLVHWFQMKRAGRGWSVIAHHSEFRRVESDPYARMENGAKQGLGTLHRVRQQFEGTDGLFHCVVEGHATAPTTIFLLVIENLTPVMKLSFLAAVAKNHEGLSLTYHVEYPWPSNIPKGVYDEWMAV